MEEKNINFLNNLSNLYDSKEDKDFINKNLILLNILSIIKENFEPLDSCYFPPNTPLGKERSSSASEDLEETKKIIRENRRAKPSKSNNELFEKNEKFFQKTELVQFNNLKLLNKSREEFINDFYDSDIENDKQMFLDQVFLLNDQIKIAINKINLIFVAKEINGCLIDLNDIEKKQRGTKADIQEKKDINEYLLNLNNVIKEYDLYNLTNDFFLDYNENDISKTKNINPNDLIIAMDNLINEDELDTRQIKSLFKKILLKSELILGEMKEHNIEPNKFINNAIQNSPNPSMIELQTEIYIPENYVVINLENNENYLQLNLKLIKFLANELSRDFNQYKNVSFTDSVTKESKKESICVKIEESNPEKSDEIAYKIQEITNEYLKIKKINGNIINFDENSLDANIDVEPLRRNNLTHETANYLLQVRNIKVKPPETRSQLTFEF